MRFVLRTLAILACLLAVSVAVPSPASAFPDCKEAPTPEIPGRGITGFFAGAPDELPPEEDPFAEESNTTIYEQYGYAGLRWHTYDLGCGPDAMRQPDAVIGTAMSNWVMQAPIALTALTGSVTQMAFEPTFLSGLDSAVERVSTALHESLFASWIPAVIAALGVLIILKARRSSLATTAGAIGWALIVILLATALFRWPVEAGRAADATVTTTLGTVVSKLDGHGGDVDPGTAVASGVSESIFYRAWLAGALGSPDSEVAREYGPDLFKAQALTWREAALLESDPEAGERLIEEKQEDWKDTAEKIKDEDPEAYEYLTGKRSETRIGYALLSALGAFLALPFLLVSALLLMGCFLIVRLAVMLFPAFATLGAFPASRGLVLGLGRTVGAAVVNAIIFGVGAGVTVAVLGILFHPGGGAPAWLGLVLMPVFSFVMWVALKPFRRLTSMAGARGNPFEDGAGAFGSTSRAGAHWAKKLAVTGAGAAAGGMAGAAAAARAQQSETADDVPDRAEARPTPEPPPLALTGAPSADRASGGAETGPRPPTDGYGWSPATANGHGGIYSATEQTPGPRELPEGFAPTPSNAAETPPPVSEAEWDDGEEIYTIYRPADDDAEATA